MTTNITRGLIESAVRELLSETVVIDTSTLQTFYETDIPDGTVDIDMDWYNVSLSGTSSPLVRIGDTTVETTGYQSNNAIARDTTATIGDRSTTGFIVYVGGGAANIFTGKANIALVDTPSGNGQYSFSLVGGTVSTTGQGNSGGGYKQTTGIANKLRFTTVNGTDTYDLGKIKVTFRKI